MIPHVLSTIALLLAFIYSPALRGQTSGSISGHLTDTTGASLPDTDVTLTQVATGAVRATKSTGSGDYTFTEVQPGTYSIQVKHQGFKLVRSDKFDVQIDQSVQLNFSLQIGAVTESVEVTATGALLQAENASTGTVIENAQINELPLNGRNYLSLAALSPNVNTLSPASGQAGSRLGGDRATQSIAVGGQRIMFDYYTLDGVNNTDPDFNTYVGLPSLDGIQEFKVQTGVYSAEYGHEASQVNVLSKSGTNTYHGSLYEYIRNNYVDAKPYFFPYQTTPPAVFPFKWNDFGFELDGPIRIPKVFDGRDKFFFMVDDEWRHIRQIGQGQAVVPTAAMVGGNFQGYSFQDATGVHPITIYDPMNNQPFQNNTIPSNNNYSYSTSSPQDRQSLTVRGDYVQSPKMQYSFRYSSGNESLSTTGLLGAGSKTVTNYYQYMGSNTWTATPTSSMKRASATPTSTTQMVCCRRSFMTSSVKSRYLV